MPLFRFVVFLSETNFANGLDSTTTFNYFSWSVSWNLSMQFLWFSYWIWNNRKTNREWPWPGWNSVTIAPIERDNSSWWYFSERKFASVSEFVRPKHGKCCQKLYNESSSNVKMLKVILHYELSLIPFHFVAHQSLNIFGLAHIHRKVEFDAVQFVFITKSFGLYCL